MSKASYEWKIAVKQTNQLCLENNCRVLASYHKATLKRWRFITRSANIRNRRIRKCNTIVSNLTKCQMLCDPN